MNGGALRLTSTELVRARGAFFDETHPPDVCRGDHHCTRQWSALFDDLAMKRSWTTQRAVLNSGFALCEISYGSSCAAGFRCLSLLDRGALQQLTLQLRRGTHLQSSSMRAAMLCKVSASTWQLPTTPARSCQLDPTCRHLFTSASTHELTAHVRHQKTFSSATYLQYTPRYFACYNCTLPGAYMLLYCTAYPFQPTVHPLL